ncbi:MAG: Spy/CpxP family protein refolding chaperone [Devosia sp.]
MKSSIAIAALVVTSLGLGAAAVPTFAQSATTTTGDGQVGLSLGATPPAPPADGNQIGLSLNGDTSAMPMDARAMMPMRGGMGRGELFVLACSGKGAEALDAALLHLSYRLDLTTAQKPLFDAFREKALTTETSFADTCTADMPQKTAGDAPDMLARMKSRLSLEQARITAMNEVLPSFETLYNSLTDAQKQALMPERGNGGFWNHDNGGMGRPMQPNRG